MEGRYRDLSIFVGAIRLIGIQYMFPMGCDPIPHYPIFQHRWGFSFHLNRVKVETLVRSNEVAYGNVCQGSNFLSVRSRWRRIEGAVALTETPPSRHRTNAGRVALQRAPRSPPQSAARHVARTSHRKLQLSAPSATTGLRGCVFVRVCQQRGGGGGAGGPAVVSGAAGESLRPESDLTPTPAETPG